MLRKCNGCNKTNFYTYKNFWPDSSVKISECRKLRLYEDLVTSVLLYNCSCWAAPKKSLDSVDILQKKHLRQILKIFRPNVISNDNLYKRCKVRPLTERIMEARWKMFVHVLRSGYSTPAYLSFRFACLTCKGDYKGRRGANRANLIDVLIKDLIKRKLISKKF